MRINSAKPLFISLCILLYTSLVACANWKSFEVEFKMDPSFKEGPSMTWKRRSAAPFDVGKGTIMIPSDMKEHETIRGVMRKTGGQLEAFALKNRVALYTGDADKPYGGPQQTFLDAAAKVSNHPELAHAGAIVWGTSNGGRFAAHFAHFWPEKTLAVILDHSFCNGPVKRVSDYSYGNLPVSPGVPYFFNASQKDLFQGFDRRKRQFNWCTEAFKVYSQACTAVVSHEAVGHNKPGDRSLQIVWLEEVLSMRVPAYIDHEGSPYQLKEVDPKKMGGHVIAALETFEERTIQTKVSAGPIGISQTPSYWVPGPESASLLLKWITKNNGVIVENKTSQIKRPVNFETKDSKLKTICSYLNKLSLKTALSKIDSFIDKCESDKADKKYLVPLTNFKTIVTEWVNDHLAHLEEIKSSGDLYYFSSLIDSEKKIFRGISAYDTAISNHKQLLREKDSKENLKAGKKFYGLVDKLKRSRSKLSLSSLKKFSESSGENIYTKMSINLMDVLSKNKDATIDIESIRSF